MCTVVLLRRPEHDWPILLASNRDEARSRLWSAPGRNWNDRPNVVGGLDELAGGTWLAVNDDGVIACVLNRAGSLGSMVGKRSRGELPLEAVDHAEAHVAAQKLAMIRPESYRSFNLIIADSKAAFWLKSTGIKESRVKISSIPEGISMITAHDLNDKDCLRVKHNLPKFEGIQTPSPGDGNWIGWQKLMGSRELDNKNNPESAMSRSDDNYGTVSSSLIGISKFKNNGFQLSWFFCEGMPHEKPYFSI